MGVLIWGAFVFSVPAQGGKAESVDRLLAEARGDVARAKCERWGAATPDTEATLREICAEAYWALADERDDETGWAAFRDLWAGTTWAERALDREARSVLRDTSPTADEGWFLELAERYMDTVPEADFVRLAANAAVRDAGSSAEAASAARRYPDHPALAGLVERYPEGFLKVTIDGRDVKVQVDPPVVIPEHLGPWVRWVLWDVQAGARPWDQAAVSLLQSWGVALGPIDQGNAGGPRVPVCHVPDVPMSETPAVEISIGSGRMYRPIGWDQGCGPDAWPVFQVHAPLGLRAVSLRPGHQVDLQHLPDAPDVRRWFPADTGGVPMLDDGAILRSAGPVQLVQPIWGGAPWVTGRPPSASATPLGENLRAAGMPAGWRLERSGDGLRVSSDALSRMPAVLRNWTLPAGEVRTLPPLVQQVLGLSPAAARAERTGAAALGPGAGWQRTASGAVERTPPTNAGVAGLYGMEVAEVVASLNVISSMGLGSDRVEAFDGWRADLDTDRTPEVVIRGLIDGTPVVMVLDPIQQNSPTSATSSRLFIAPSPGVLANSSVAGTPFSFRKGDHVYMAWSGVTHTGKTTTQTSLSVVRFDGTGYVVDDFEL